MASELVERAREAIAVLEEAIARDTSDRGLRLNLAACRKTLKQAAGAPITEPQVSASHCARMVIMAKAQAYEEAVRWLELVEKVGDRVVPHLLAEARKKRDALQETGHG
ncbi:MAG: hypothetical protein ACOY4R_27875 [Pseudomonadota bacterium]